MVGQTVTFPALRERLLPYRVELYDIDLRWGITDDEASHRATSRLYSNYLVGVNGTPC
jgi:hypothetical protein